MSEMPYWPNAEVMSTANGWIVRPSVPLNRTTMSGPDDSYCFVAWQECADFLAVVTKPQRAPDNGS